MARDISVRQVDPDVEGSCVVDGCSRMDKIVYKVSLGLLGFRICEGCFNEIANKLHEARDVFKAFRRNKK